MDVKYILVVLIIILFIVNIGFLFYMNSQVSALQSAYSALASDYNTAVSDYSTVKSMYSSLYNNYTNLVNMYNSLASKYNSLYMNFTTLMNEYKSLSQNYSTLSSEYNTLTGLTTIYNFFVSLSQVNTNQMESLMVGPMPVYFQITSPPGNGTVIATPSNFSTALADIGSHLSQYFDYITIRSFTKELIIYYFGSYMLGEGLLAFKNVNANGTTVNNYAIIYVVGQNIAPYKWQITYVKIDNSIYVYQYNMISTGFQLIQNLETKNLGALLSTLLGPYSSYVYIAQGPFAGNYSGPVTVEDMFIDTIIAKEIQSVSFTPFYFTIQFTSNQTGIVRIYGNMSITLTNGTSYTYPTELKLIEQLEPNGEFQITGFNILNDLTVTQIQSIIPK